MEKRICIITGANAGIGRAAAGQIADAGLHVIMACRNQERGEAARELLLKENPGRSLELQLLDMSSQSSIRRFAQQITETYPTIDVLIHNAAAFDISQKHPEYTLDGIESVWATNHIGPVLLTELLLDTLKTSTDARIITIASKGLIVKPNLKIRLDDPEFRKDRFSVTKAYYQSKRAQVMYTYYLSEQLKATPVTVNCIRVTNVRIDITRYPDLSNFLKWLYSIKSKKSITPQQMANTYTYAAISPELKGKTGLYLDEHNKPVKSVNYTYDAAIQKQLMAVTRQFIQDRP